MAAAGDTINVDCGTYTISTPIIITQASLTIQTTPGESQAVLNGTNISASSTINPYCVSTTYYDDDIEVSANSDVVNNFTIEGGGTSGTANFECVCLYGNNDILETCTCEYGYWGGADISNWDSNTQVSGDEILSCYFYDNSLVNANGLGTNNWRGGVGMNNCINSRISGCTVYYNWGEGLTGSNNNAAGGNNAITNNTVSDSWSGELYINCGQGYTVANNLIYTDSNWPQPSRFGYPSDAIGIDNEGCESAPGSDPYPTKNGNIFNNICIGGANCFTYSNSQLWSGFYDGGLNGYNIYNNVFYNTSNISGEGPCVNIYKDPGNNFTFRNNIIWDTNNSILLSWFAGSETNGAITYSNEGISEVRLG